MVLKHRLPDLEDFTLHFHQGGRIVQVGPDADGQPAIWVEADIHQPIDPIPFRLVGTGTPLPADEKSVYIGTIVGECTEYHLYRILEDYYDKHL